MFLLHVRAEPFPQHCHSLDLGCTNDSVLLSSDAAATNALSTACPCRIHKLAFEVWSPKLYICTTLICYSPFQFLGCVIRIVVVRMFLLHVREEPFPQLCHSLDLGCSNDSVLSVFTDMTECILISSFLLRNITVLFWSCLHTSLSFDQEVSST